jgi:hypothetical protein
LVNHTTDITDAARNHKKSEVAKCKIKNADLGVLFDLAIKYDKMIITDPAKDKNEQVHVIKAIVKAFPVNILFLHCSTKKSKKKKK